MQFLCKNENTFEFSKRCLTNAFEIAVTQLRIFSLTSNMLKLYYPPVLFQWIFALDDKEKQLKNVSQRDNNQDDHNVEHFSRHRQLGIFKNNSWPFETGSIGE